MADVILTDVLNGKITIDALTKWLTAENHEETSFDFSQNGSMKTDFTSYFLNYLRDHCKRLLPEIKEEKPTIKVPEISRAESPQNKVPIPKNVIPPHSVTKQESSDDSKVRNAGHQIVQPRAVLMNCSSPRNSSPSSKSSIAKKSSISPITFPPLPNQQDGNSPLARGTVRKVPTTILQQSIESPNFLHDRLPVHQNLTNSSRHNDILDTREFLSMTNEDKFCEIDYAQEKFEILDLSGKDNESLNCSFEISSPRRLDDSRINGSFVANSSLGPCSPISPLYAKNTSTLCPRRVDVSHNDSLDYSRNSGNMSTTSTPKSGQKTTKTKSDHKNVKTTQSHSVCLGDFMISDEKGTKKKSRKLMRTQLWRESQERKKLEGEKPKNPNESQCKTTNSKSKRRIKPTRLNVSGDKEIRGPEVFGVISRPNTANPNFIEAPSTDKSQEELSFEVERGLLKLERQRQPKSAMPVEIANVEAKLSFKTKPETTIVPQLDLVSNVEKIETLISIYGIILDRNLMTNPMTEIYFLMTLVTTPYSESPDTATRKFNLEESSEVLEPFKDDLGCSKLSDVSTEINNEDSVESSNHDETRDDGFSMENHEKCHENVLDTPHNCVYFATTVMFNQRRFLNILDRTTLKLLYENQQIANFQPELQKYLNELYSVKCAQTHQRKQTESGNSQSNVCFQVDTDNCETFPSPVAFALFRKQRDMFYEILKDWEDNHLQPGWSFQRSLKNKINTLLTLHTDAVNYCHFAKLFISQLLISSGQSGKTEDFLNDESLSFLKSLKHLNPEKLIQLKGRLVTPLTSTGPVPQPAFTGVQEFYEQFILNACNWKFYVILENILVSEIMELNAVQFAWSEIEATETIVEESTKQNFLTCVSNLRLLAKFTSFTMTLPFRSAADSPEWLLSQIQLRGRVQPAMDLRTCLIDALTHRRLSLTVPWVVQFMAMLDTVTLRLPYYVNISEILYCIYRMSYNHKNLNGQDFLISPQTSMLMIFTIGWFFELPNFPHDLYVNWQINHDEKKLRRLKFSNNPSIKCSDTIDEKSSDEKFVKCNLFLDALDIIDDRVVYECCPFLSEFKILLISGNATSGSTNANRHITPVSSQLSQPIFGVKSRNLQTQLEEAFFHGQPSSIRRTADFVSERVASSCVKYIWNSIIPSSKKRNMKDFIKSMNGEIDLIQREEESEDKNQTSPTNSSSNSAKKTQTALIGRQMRGLATTIKDDVKCECSKVIIEMCEKRTINSIDSLLADDALPDVKESCIAITKRMAIERVEQWIESHIVESLFLKNMTFELKKLLKDGDSDPAHKEHCHNPKVPCPTEVIEMMRNSMWELLEKQGRWAQLSVNSVTEILKCLSQTLTQRADLIEYPERNLYTMSVEYSLLLITHRQDLFTPKIQSKFIEIWKMQNSRVGEKEGLFVRIISSRNIRLLTSTSKTTVMKIFGRLLGILLKDGLLNIESLSDQCVALFRQEWPEVILKQLSQCLRDVVSNYKCSGHDAESIKYLLDWIATTCDCMEICDYD